MEHARRVLAVDPPPPLRGLLDAICNDRWHPASESEARNSPDAVILVPAGTLVALLSTSALPIAIGPPADALPSLRAGAFGFLREPVTEEAARDLLHAACLPRAEIGDIAAESAVPNWITLAVSCKLEALDRLLQWLRVFEADLPANDRDDILTAVRELSANAVEHGAQSDPDKRLRISRWRTRRARGYLIQDPGEGFSMNDLSHAAVSNGPGEPLRHVDVRHERGIRPGGFGILMSRNLADELIYNEKGNEVLFIKYTTEL